MSKLGAFCASPLGGFIESPLGARGCEESLLFFVTGGFNASSFIAFSPTGEILWERSFGGVRRMLGHPAPAAPMPDGTTFIAYTDSGDFIIERIAADGAVIDSVATTNFAAEYGGFIVDVNYHVYLFYRSGPVVWRLRKIDGNNLSNTIWDVSTFIINMILYSDPRFLFDAARLDMVATLHSSGNDSAFLTLWNKSDGSFVQQHVQHLFDVSNNRLNFAPVKRACGKGDVSTIIHATACSNEVDFSGGSLGGPWNRNFSGLSIDVAALHETRDFVGLSTDGIRRLDADDGAVVWSHAGTYQSIACTPGAVWAKSTANLVRLNPSDGSVESTTALPDDVANATYTHLWATVHGHGHTVI